MTNLSNMHNQDQTLFDWVANIIKSCYHDFHFEGADRLIALYYEREKDEQKKVELEMMRKQRWDDIHVILH